MACGSQSSALTGAQSGLAVRHDSCARGRCLVCGGGGYPRVACGCAYWPAGRDIWGPAVASASKGDTYKISIEKSKFLGGDLEHTHLVKGLDYALLQKIRSEMTKETKGDAAQEADGDQRAKPTERVEIRSAQAKAIYSLMFEKKEKRAPVNERFLPGRTSFVFDMEDFASEVPTTVLRSKEDCPPYEELVGVGVDKKALESLTKIMTYLRLGTTGKALKKLRRKERLLTEDQDDVEDEKEKAAADKARMARDKDGARNAMPPPPPPPRPHDDDDIFEGVGREYQCALPPEPPSRSNGAAGHEGEASDAGAQRGRPQGSYFDQPSDEAVPLPPPEDAYMPPLPPPPPGLPPLLPPNPPLPPEPQWAQHGYLPGYPPPPTYMPDASGWQPPLPPAPPPGYAMGVYAVDPSLWAADVAAAAAGLHMPPPPPPVAYGYAGAAGADDVAGKAGHEPGGAKGYDTGLTVEEKNQGLGSVFKRDDQRLKQMREKDDREKDPMFVSDSYSECYPSYQNFNTEVMDGSDDEEDLTKMDMGAKAKGRMHRWDFETEEEWSAYNENKEAMPKAAFQYGVKMADGRKTRKTKEQKLNTQYQQITQIWKKKERDSANEANAMAWPEPEHPGKKAKY
eukprot:jgi/Mesvir1/2283/Mv19322-RA.2